MQSDRRRKANSSAISPVSVGKHWEDVSPPPPLRCIRYRQRGYRLSRLMEPIVYYSAPRLPTPAQLLLHTLLARFTCTQSIPPQIPPSLSLARSLAVSTAPNYATKSMLFYQRKTELRRDSGWSQTCSCLHFVLNDFLLKDGMPAIHFYLSLVVQTNTKSAPRRLAQKTLKNWMHCNNYIQKQNANAADWHKCYVIRLRVRWLSEFG